MQDWAYQQLFQDEAKGRLKQQLLLGLANIDTLPSMTRKGYELALFPILVL